MAVEIITARWAMSQGRSPAAALRAADRAVGRALEVNPENAVAYQSAAEVHRWRAEWSIQRGRGSVDEIRAGAASAGRTLADKDVVQTWVAECAADIEAARERLLDGEAGKHRGNRVGSPYVAPEPPRIGAADESLIPDDLLP